MEQRIVEADSRRRISLGDLAKHDRYLASADPDGTIILTPAVVLTVQQYNKLLSTGDKG